MIEINPFYNDLFKKFRIIRFIVLSWVFAAFCAFVFLIKAENPFERPLGIILIIIISLSGGLVVFAHSYLFKKTLKAIKQTDNKKSDTPVKEDWDFVSALKPFKVFCFKPKKILSGKNEGRDFNLYKTYIYQPAKGTLQHDYFLIHTKPIKELNCTILIKPKSFVFNAGKFIDNSLEKRDIDTQNLFDIFIDNYQEPLPSSFIRSLIEYGAIIDKDITLLISPKGIILFKKINRMLMIDFLLESSATQISKILNDYEDTKNLLDLINLLEKKK